MPEGTGVQTTPQGPAGDAGTSIEKFKSAEDRDKAYLELEKVTRTQAEAMANMQRQVEELTLTIGSRDQGQQDQGGYYDQGYGRGQTSHQVPNQQDVLRRFYSDPMGVIDEKLQHHAATVLTAIDQRLANQEMVADFKRENPDLIKHEDLVASFVRKQAPNIPPKERLTRASKDARAYLSDIARGGQGGQQQAHVDPNTYVEAPSGQGTTPALSPAPEPSQEDEVTKWIKERETMRHKRML